LKPYPAGLGILQRRFVNGTVSRLMAQLAPFFVFPLIPLIGEIYRSSFNHHPFVNEDNTVCNPSSIILKGFDTKPALALLS
jgi:hypothetical protein